MKRYVDWALQSLIAAFILGVVLGRSGKSTPAADGLETPGPAAGFIAAPRGVELPSRSAGILEPSKSIVLAMVNRFAAHNTTLIAASLAYYALFALFPALIAAVSIFGLVADPEVLETQVADFTEDLPGTTGEFISDQITALVDTSAAGLGVTSVIAIIAALWSASAGTKALISAINIAYDARDERSYVVKRAVALLVTFSIIVLGLLLAGAIAFLPQILRAMGFDDDAISLMELARWPSIFVIVVLGLGALYKLAPNRPLRASPLLNWGAALAAVGWLLATVGLGLYVDNFSSLPETYGTLTGIVVAMLWFFTSGMVILSGAELNSELEQRQAYAGRPHQGGGPGRA